MQTNLRCILASTLAIGLVLALFITPAMAAQAGAADYRTFFNLDSRLVIWIIAELHLMFGAFVLGVPIFAVIIEFVGVKTGDPRYDALAHEFTKLLTGAYAFTALLGGLFGFALFSLYPTLMNYMTGVFHDSMFIYGLLFFVESTTLYLYYYLWKPMRHRKGWHIFIGVMLNVWGTILMMVANSWVTFMMSPAGVDPKTGDFIGTVWQATVNPLWLPLGLHRILGNIAFGGFICGAYAAIKFLGSKTPAEKAHYDWMGYVGNFVAVCGLLPIPFAGYYLGREVYSTSAVMGNNMMGGAFSWTFIIQAILIGGIFVATNYYLWIGMDRIPGAERYKRYIKYLGIMIFIAFAVWMTPHNLPLSAEEQMMVGGQYHPTLKYLGLMSGKNAVINLIILTTFLSFLLYRRANKGDGIPISQQGVGTKLILGAIAAICLAILGNYAYSLFTLDPASMDLAPEKAQYFMLPAVLLLIQMGALLITLGLTFVDRGKLAQMAYLGISIISTTFILGLYGYKIMAVASPFLRNVALAQWIILMTSLLYIAAIDIFLFRKAPVIGPLRWGQVPNYSQYVLIFLCIWIVQLIGLMGFVRSGLRENWHIYAVMKDTSPDAWTPDNFLMAKMVSICVILFLGVVSFLFWLAQRGDQEAISALPEQPADDASVISGADHEG